MRKPTEVKMKRAANCTPKGILDHLEKNKGQDFTPRQIADLFSVGTAAVKPMLQELFVMNKIKSCVYQKTRRFYVPDATEKPVQIEEPYWKKGEINEKNYDLRKHMRIAMGMRGR